MFRESNVYHRCLCLFLINNNRLRRYTVVLASRQAMFTRDNFWILSLN